MVDPKQPTAARASTTNGNPRLTKTTVRCVLCFVLRVRASAFECGLAPRARDQPFCRTTAVDCMHAVDRSLAPAARASAAMFLDAEASSKPLLRPLAVLSRRAEAGKCSEFSKTAISLHRLPTRSAWSTSWHSEQLAAQRSRRARAAFSLCSFCSPSAVDQWCQLAHRARQLRATSLQSQAL